MKEHHHIDELIRQKFDGFEPVPPPYVWDKVKSGIQPDTTPGGGISLPIITGLIILVGLVSLLWLISRMESTLPAQAENTPALSDNISTLIVPAEDHLVANASYLSNQESNQLNSHDRQGRILTSSPIPVRKPFEGYSQEETDPARRIDYTNHPKTVKHKRKLEADKIQRFSEEPWRIKTRQFEISTTNPDLLAAHTIRENWTAGDNEDYVKQMNTQWSIGLFFNPEVTFYPSDNISNGLNYSLQVLPRVSFNSWYLQSGVGVRGGGDHGDLHINYNKFLGSYEDVYEVTFDSTENGLVPVYHTENVDVYDTIPYYSISESRVSYAYLDIPLLVGYEWSGRKVSFYVNAGPSFSVLLGRSSPQADYPEENIRILNESPQIPAREQINWQLMAGAGLSYALSDRVSLGLEPTFRYYLTKDFDKNRLNTRHPYSFGLRAGLIYRINQ